MLSPFSKFQRPGALKEVTSLTPTKGYVVPSGEMICASGVGGGWFREGPLPPVVRIHFKDSDTSPPPVPEVPAGADEPELHEVGHQNFPYQPVFTPTHVILTVFFYPDELRERQDLVHSGRLLPTDILRAGPGNFAMGAWSGLALATSGPAETRRLYDPLCFPATNLTWEQLIGSFAVHLGETSPTLSAMTKPREQSWLQEAAAKALLPGLESARSPGERRQLFRILTQLSTPEAVVETAFDEYGRTGREAFLLHAVSLLEGFGKRALPALLLVARSGRPESELFLGLIARCPGVNADQRSGAFRLLAKHAPPSVRLQLLEHLSSLGTDRERTLLGELAMSDSDDGVKAEAGDRLSTLTKNDH